MRLLPSLLIICLAACAGALVGAVTQPTTRHTASPQAVAYFARMMRAHDSLGVEQAACVTRWTFAVRDGVRSLHLERVEPAINVHNATIDGIEFACDGLAGTVHTHSFVCAPSALDSEGEETFGVVVCPRPTRFAVFAVRPAAP